MTNKQIIAALKRSDLTKFQNLNDLFEMARIENDLDLNEEVMWLSAKLAREKGDLDFYNLHKKTLLFAAPHRFDAYMMYVEFDRPPEKKFYVPRRKVLKTIVDDLHDLEDGKLDFLSISLPPRTGKAQPYDAKVLTPSGFVDMGDLVVGDCVIGDDGKPAKISHIFEQGVKDVYRVHFDDGSSTECCKEHLWTVQTADDRRYGKSRTEKLEDIWGNLKRGKEQRNNYSIPMVKPVEFAEQPLPIHPYVLGVLLGDGSLTNGARFTNREEDIIRKIASLLPPSEELSAQGNGRESLWGIKKKDDVRDASGFMTQGPTLQGLVDLGLYGKRSHEKFIPGAYLINSVANRVSLLQGLLDTDGYVHRATIEYSTTSAQLAYGVRFLVQSLGGRVTMQERTGHYKQNGVTYQTRKNYRLFIHFPDGDIVPVSSEKHLAKYNPKRSEIKRFIDSVEYVGRKPCRCIVVNNESHLYVTDDFIVTHNTTLGCFFITWLMGKYPDLANVMSGHSEKLTSGFYQEVLSILTDPQYLWADVFPGRVIAATSAKDLTIDIDRRKRFSTLTCRSIGGTLTGAVEVTKCLYCDDLVEDLEEALNPQRLENKYNAYANQLKDRRKEGSYQVMIGTRWSVHDVQGRIQAQYEGNPRYRFRVIPALNEHGESNFDYPYGLGFSTAYYMDMKESIDDATWCAKYMGEPYEREGLLFPKEELNYYNGTLPDGEPDRILAAGDIAWGGGDSLSMPIAYIYGDICYIHDVMFNNGDKEVTRPIVVGKLKQHKPHMTRFEANNGGDEYADKVDELLRAEGVKLNISHRKSPSNQSKMSRIIQYSPEIKRFYFRDYKNSNQEYRKFMDELTSFTVSGKNKHDDAPDSLAMLAHLMEYGRGSVEVFKRLF